MVLQAKDGTGQEGKAHQTEDPGAGPAQVHPEETETEASHSFCGRRGIHQCGQNFTYQGKIDFPTPNHFLVKWLQPRLFNARDRLHIFTFNEIFRQKASTNTEM